MSSGSQRPADLLIFALGLIGVLVTVCSLLWLGAYIVEYVAQNYSPIYSGLLAVGMGLLLLILSFSLHLLNESSWFSSDGGFR